MSEIVVRFKPKQLLVLQAIGSLIDIREKEDNNHKKTNINAGAISRMTGLDYKTTKKYLKQFKDL